MVSEFAKLLDELEHILDLKNKVSHEEYVLGLEKYLVKIKYFFDRQISSQSVITEKSETEFQYFEKFFHNVLENINLIAVILDHSANIVFCNNFLATHTGWEREELIGKNWIQTFIPESNRQEFMESISKDGDLRNFETSFRCKDGKIIIGLVSANPITFNDEKYLLSLIRDISDRKQIETEILKAKEKAEESDRLKSAFLANMSHEIRTPMNGIIGFADMLAMPNLPEEKKLQYVETIKNGSYQLLNIINDITDFAKIDAGQIDISISDFNLNNLLKSIYSSFETAARKKNIVFKLKLELTEQKSYIKGDFEKIRQILKNLVSNALKFTQQGQIELGYKIKDKMLLFYVKDKGIGIPKHLQDVIFERFRQADNSLTRQYGGMGLGLSISKAYVELLGGKIWLDSTPGEGTVFYFTLNYIPFVQTEETSVDIDTVDNNIVEQFDWKSKTILIAEDEDINFHFLEELFEESGAKIIRANNGLEAVEAIQNNKQPDVVLMDIKMPVMDGYEATRQIKKLRPQLPIIAITAYALTGDSNKALEVGCVSYLSKPINTKQLFEVVGKYLVH